MKLRYWAFAYDTYYPGGGLNDCIGHFETIEEARAALAKEFADHYEIVFITDDYTPEEVT